MEVLQMGFFSEMKKSFMEGYNQSMSSGKGGDGNSSQGLAIRIIFSPSQVMRMSEDVRKEAMEVLFIQLNTLFGLEVKKDYLGVFYLIMEDEDAVTPMWLNFVIYNGKYLIKQGTCGMGQGGIVIQGPELLKEVAKEVINLLEKLEFEDIQLYNDDIPFHEADWLDESLNEIKSNVEELRSSSVDDDAEDDETEDNDEDNDEDEDEEDGEAEDDVTDDEKAEEIQKKLAKYKDLFDKGLIDEDEYKSMKAKVLKL